MTVEVRTKYDFETGIYRPPSEGGSSSLLIRVTRNCPWNRCTFCSMYKGQRFQLRSPEEVKGDVDTIAAICKQLKSLSHDLGYGGEINRNVAFALLEREPELNKGYGFPMVYEWLLSGGKTAFLQDANSLILPALKLVDILKHLRKTFPSLNRVTTYARSRTLMQRKLVELTAIRKAGLDRLHVGLETGDDTLLEKINKGVTGRGHIEGGRKAKEAGFQLSEYWMPGLGGREMWENHATNTAKVLNKIDPDYIRSRPFYPSPGSPLFEDCRKGTFQPLSSREQLVELQWFIENLQVTSRVCFDHAGNRWRGQNGGLLLSQSYEGYKFPDEKQRVLQLIHEGIKVHG